MTTGNPRGMKWRPITEAPTAPLCNALIAARDAEGTYLLADIYCWKHGEWRNETDETPLVISAGRDQWWMSEEELLAPLEADVVAHQPGLVDAEFIAAAESRN